MKKLDLLILKSALGPFLATFFIGNLVFLMQFIYRKLDEIVGKGLGLDVLGEFVFYASFTVIPYTLPLAVLIASIMTMGNLGERYELVAIKSSGISLLRAMRSLIIASFVMAGVAFFFSNTVMPWSLLKLSALLNTIQHKKPTMMLDEGVFYQDFDQMTMKVERKGEDGTLYDLIIYDHRKPSENTVIRADSARIINSDTTNYMLLDLMDGKIHTDKNNQKEFIRYSFKRQTFPIDMSKFALGESNERLFENNPRVQDVTQIRENIDSIKLKIADRKVTNKNQLSQQLGLIKQANDTLPQNPSLNYHKPVQIDSLRLYRQAISKIKGQRHNLSASQTNLKSIKKSLINNEIAFYQKFALAISCIILFFIGAPVGALVRKGGFGMPIVISVFFYLLYYVLDIIGKQVAEEGKLPPVIGMWLSTIVLFPIAVLLTQRALADKQFNPFKSIQTFINSLKKN